MSAGDQRDPGPSRSDPIHWAEARAPASVGNISVGFDLLGHALEVAGDEVRVERIDAPGAGQSPVVVEAIEGLPLELPLRARENTAGAALLAFRKAVGAAYGYRVRIRKGIPLGSGMGGSAASAVAAVVAANALLEEPLTAEALYPFALAGEGVASGSPHGDNVAPQLLGGVVLALPDRIQRLPVPWPLHAALVHPHQVLETRRARAVLAEPFPLEAVVEQSGLLARFITACHTGDQDLLEGSLRDVLVEPRRAPLIPGFAQARRAALEAGALGAGISGGGPSLFAWCWTAATAGRAAAAMKEAFGTLGIEADAWTAPVEGPAAEVLRCG